MSITNECMVMNISIGVWSGHKLDKDQTRKVTEEAGADGDAARVNKHLVPKEALAPIVQAGTAIREHFYKVSLPWKDNGDRLMPRRVYMRFAEKHGQLVKEFDDAVDKFLTEVYPQTRMQAEFRMGQMFRESDYPAPWQLRSKFYVRAEIDAISEAGDFRVALDEGMVEEIKADMTRALDMRVSKAMGDVWGRLGECVTHLMEKLKDEKAIFRNSTIQKLEDLIEVLPDLNVMNDPALQEIYEDVKARLGGHDPEELRKNKAVRKAVAQDAQEIIDAMSGFMSAFRAAA